MLDSVLDHIHAELGALYNLARRLNLHDLAATLRSEVLALSREIGMQGSEKNGPATLKATVREVRWRERLDILRDEVAKSAQANADQNSKTGAANTTEQERQVEVLRQLAQAMGTDINKLLHPPLSQPLSSTGSQSWGLGQQGPGPTPSGPRLSDTEERLYPESRATIEEWRQWKVGELKATLPLERVFMRQCPCCGSDVFYDRDKDAVLTIDPEAGYIKIRLKNGQIREVKVAEAALEP